MEMLEQFMSRNNLRDEEDIDSLLEVADLARELIGGNRYEEICRLIDYTVENSFYEAFSWIMEILQEEFDKQDSCALDDFVCRLGKSIPDYDAFSEKLQVDFRALKNDIETMLDENKEVQSFFNILTYQTKFKNIYLVTLENFDTKDNDFIQYRLSFQRT